MINVPSCKWISVAEFFQKKIPGYSLFSQVPESKITLKTHTTRTIRRYYARLKIKQQNRRKRERGLRESRHNRPTEYGIS